MADLEIRLATLTDLPTIGQVQALCYQSQYLEPVEAFSSKLHAGHPTWLIFDKEMPLGYLTCVVLNVGPGQDPEPPALSSSAVPTLPNQPNALYLHDLAIAPIGRGRGVAAALLQAAAHWAEQYQTIRRMALIAVQDSQSFWRKQGFTEPESVSQVIANKLNSYGPGACYMVKTLA